MTSDAPQSAAAGGSAEVADYVARVAAALGDLPPDTRQELLEDLPDHLTEVLAESGGPLSDRLGPPEAYAAELRAAAAGEHPAGSAARPGLAVLSRQWRERLDRLDVRLGPTIGYARVTEFLRLLRPAWWVLRGYLAAMLVALVLSGDDSLGLLPRLGDSDLVGLLVLVAFVAGSVWLARQPSQTGRWPRRVLRAGTLVLAAAAFIGFLTVDSNARQRDFGRVYYDNDRYGHVQDVFVYDRDGRLLEDVRLFDQDGQPIQLGHRECDEELPPVRPPTAGNAYPYCPQRAPYGAPPPRPDAPRDDAPPPADAPRPGTDAPVPLPPTAAAATPSPAVPTVPAPVAPTAGPVASPSLTQGR